MDLQAGIINIQLSNAISENLCRTCLMESINTQSIFQSEYDKMLMKFTTIQICIGDGLPSQICGNCAMQITQAFNFKFQVESCDTTLRQYFNVYKAPEHLSGKDTSIKEPIDSNNYEKRSEILNTLKENQILFQQVDSENDTVDYKIEKDTEDQVSPNEKPSKQLFECHICKEKYEGECAFKKHEESHESDHICGTCNKRFKNKSILKTHIRHHLKIERKFECTECGKQYCAQNELNIHKRKHTGERPMVCSVCGKSFADPRSLAKHNKIHSGERKYECIICQKKFIHSYTLKAHMRVHTGEKPFICSVCGHGCATSTQLTLHSRTHSQEKPYHCQHCPKAFASGSGLTAHQMTHTGERKFMCSLCGKRSRTATDLAAHLRTHTGEKPFECRLSGCTKRYKTHSQLSAHLRTHTGEKPHQCTICNKSFADTTQLKSHVNIHTGIKPYVCTVCNYRFTQSGTLHTHMKSHKRAEYSF